MTVRTRSTIGTAKRAGTGVGRRRFTVDEYRRMAEAGIFTEDDRVELLDGEVVAMAAIGNRHALCVNLCGDIFADARPAILISIQNPIILSDFSEPEPDVVLLRRRPGLYADAHPGPEDIVLIIEVADTTLAHDRRKVVAYGRAGVPESWIVDLKRGRLEVYRRPAGGEYTERRVLGRDDELSPLLLPNLTVRVDAILPDPA